MSYVLITGLLLGVIAYLATVTRRQQKAIEDLKRAREDLQLEENRVFDFLHGLGEAFSEDVRIAELHRLIVEGAMRILDAHGGTLYLADRTGKLLVPAFVSKGCPPFVEVPQQIQQQTGPAAVENYLRLHPVKAGEGLIGTVWDSKEPLFLSSKDHESRLGALKHNALQLDSIIAAPLVYAGQYLGVLAVGNGPMSMPFSSPDFVVFQSIVEQSAFALYNARVYSEADEKRRIDRDLAVARDIQRILLPARPPELDGFEIAAINLPAGQVSGDYYDYVGVNENKCGIVIADVSGKGVPASLIMATCRSVLRSAARAGESAAGVLQQVNRQLYPDIKEDMFISMAYLLLERGNGDLQIARAGHDAPLHFRAKDCSVVRINPPGMALGIDSGGVFDRVTRDFRVHLETGDCLVLYTDGVTEALDVNGLEFGISRLIEVIRAHASESASTVVSRVTEQVESFVGNHPQNDDITLVAIRKL